MIPSNKKLRFLIKDEKKASAEYKRYGYRKLSSDEASHKRFLSKKLKNRSYKRGGERMAFRRFKKRGFKGRFRKRKGRKRRY